MALPDTRYRARYLFAAVMVGHILLISAQVNSRSGVPLLQAAMVTALTETQRVVWGGVGGVHAAWNRYVALQGVHEENVRLEREAADLRVQLQQERTVARGSEQLRTLLDLRQRVPWQTIGAEVIAGSASPNFRAITIDKGREAGVHGDMPVITPAGIVGRVVLPSTHAATVQLIIDSNAAAAGVVERSRAQGIALGNGDGTLRFEYISAIADIQRGDLVVTAGMDGVYPKGLVLGYVDRVERDGRAGRTVTVRPAVDFSSLESVLVMLAPTPIRSEAGKQDLP